MLSNFKEYIADVKSQLNCNATDYYKDNYVTYCYTNEQIDNNLAYFERCFESNLSAYKALLFFSDVITKRYVVKYKILKPVSYGEEIVEATDKWNAYDIFMNSHQYYDVVDINVL